MRWLTLAAAILPVLAGCASAPSGHDRPVASGHPVSAEQRSENARKMMARSCIDAPMAPKALEAISAMLEVPQGEAKSKACDRIVDAVLAGTITDDDFKRVDEGDPEAVLKLALVLTGKDPVTANFNQPRQAPSNPRAFAASAQAADEASARAFFDDLVKLADSYDLRVGDWYAQDAKVTLVTRLRDGRLVPVTVTGSQARKLIIKFMPVAQRTGEHDVHEQIKITVQGKRARIAGTRYGTGNCYLDRGWYMVIEAQPDRTYRIVEEHSTADETASCGSST